MQDTQLLPADMRTADAPVAADIRRVERVRSVGAIVLVALPFLLFWPTTQSLLVRWQDAVHRTYTHGLLIVALALWLLWRSRARPMSEPIRAFVPGVALLFAGSLLWLIAYRAGLQIVHQALLPLLAFASVVTCFGWAFARCVWLPVGYLYFAIPVWDAINPLLQAISVLAVRLLLRGAGIPAYFSGDTFRIPAGSFEIASGCSGLHFFVVAVALAVLYGEINNDTWRTRLKLIALAGALAMITNWVRIFIIVLAGHMTDMRHYLVSGEHYSFGWFMFAGAMLLFFGIARRWPLEPTSAAPVDADVARREIPRAGFALAIAPLLPVVAFNLFDRDLADGPGQVLPASVAGWGAGTSSFQDWRPAFKGADVEQQLAYGTASRTIEAYAATYLRQRQGKEAVGYGNSPLGSALSEEGRPRAARNGWIELSAQDSRGQDWLVWYVYRLDEQWYSKPLDLQFAYGLKSLASAPLTSVVALRAPCAGSCETARDLLEQFTAVAFSSAAAATAPSPDLATQSDDTGR